MENTVVKIDNLVKRYGELVALDHFSLEIKEGEIFGLLGPNGSGKTTTINCLLSLLSFDKGNIEIFGRKMTPVSYDIKKDIGIIMQNVVVSEELTVRENIDYFCGLYITDKKLRAQYVDEAIKFVGLEDFTKFYPKKLSGDEPTVAVDPQSRNKTLEGIQELNRSGVTIIYTSHYMEEVEQICTRIAIMDKGRKVAEGTKDELKRMIQNTETISIEVLGLGEDILAEMRALPHVYDVKYDEKMLVVSCSGGKHNLIRALDVLQKHEVGFGRVYSELPTLNEVFLEITGKALRDKED